MSDNEINKFDDEMDNEEFQQMLEDSLTRKDDFFVGDKVKGKVVYITDSSAFVDISGKSEAIIDLSELSDNDGNCNIKIGDEVEAYIVSIGRGEIQLTTSIGKGTANTQLLQTAYENSIPVEGTPVEVVKGGYSVSISDVRCFCPFSQIALKAPPNPEIMLNKSFSFRIIEYKENGKNIILSRRVFLEEDRQVKLDQLKSSLEIGNIIEGTVSSIQNFGIFIEIGGTEALIPKSEISWGRNFNTGAFSAGQKISAKVISINWEENRIALSIKQLTPEPWKTVEKYSIGETMKRKVVNIINQGAFVELEPGLEGFIHISKMSPVKRINRPEDAVSIGDEVNIKILNIKTDEKKLSLELLTGELDPWEHEDESILNELHTGTIESSKSAGVTVRLSNGLLGFVPREELSNEKNIDVQKKYQTGNEIVVMIKQIDYKNRRCILSELEAEKNEMRKDYKEYADKNLKSEGSSLGNQFKQKFDEMQKKMNE